MNKNKKETRKKIAFAVGGAILGAGLSFLLLKNYIISVNEKKPCGELLRITTNDKIIGIGFKIRMAFPNKNNTYAMIFEKQKDVECIIDNMTNVLNEWKLQDEG